MSLKTRNWYFLLTIQIAIVIFYGFSSLASLGDKIDSISYDQQVLRAQRKITVSDQYTVHELTSNQNVVKEYVSPAGIVFAVVWRGKVHPDLSILLGSYFNDYTHILTQDKSKGHAPRVTIGTSLRVERSGHMGDVRGKAFDPALVPAGISAEDLK